MKHGVIIKNFKDGTTTFMTKEEWAKAWGKVSRSQREAAEVMKIAETIDDLSFKLFKLSNEGVLPSRMRGMMEGYSSLLGAIANDLIIQID